MFQLLNHFLILLVNFHQKLQLLAFLTQKLFVLLQELLIGRKSACILTDSFIKWSLNRTDIVSEGYFYELASMHAYYLHSARLFLHIVFLAKDITFAEFAHEDCFFPNSVPPLEPKFFIDIGLSLNKE